MWRGGGGRAAGSRGAGEGLVGRGGGARGSAGGGGREQRGVLWGFGVPQKLRLLRRAPTLAVVVLLVLGAATADGEGARGGHPGCPGQESQWVLLGGRGVPVWLRGRRFGLCSPQGLLGTPTLVPDPPGAAVAPWPMSAPPPPPAVSPQSPRAPWTWPFLQKDRHQVGGRRLGQRRGGTLPHIPPPQHHPAKSWDLPAPCLSFPPGQGQGWGGGGWQWSGGQSVGAVGLTSPCPSFPEPVSPAKLEASGESEHRIGDAGAGRGGSPRRGSGAHGGRGVAGPPAGAWSAGGTPGGLLPTPPSSS